MLKVDGTLDSGINTKERFGLSGKMSLLDIIILDNQFTIDNVDKLCGIKSNVQDMCTSGVQMDGIASGTAVILGDATGGIGTGANKIEEKVTFLLFFRINIMDFKKKPILGMLHLYGGMKAMEIFDEELEIFEKEGVDGYIIENYGGGLEEVRQALKMIEEFDEYDNMFKGINILPNDFERAYALAAAYNLDFIQLDYVAGVYKGRRSGEIISLDTETFKRLRDKFPDIKILGGVWPKYYEPIDNTNRGLMDAIDDAKELCDAIVVTGAGTGSETPVQKIEQFRGYVGRDFPLIVGAGLDEFNVEQQLAIANGGIVGSYLKTNGQATGKVEQDRVRDFMAKVNKYRVKALL